MLVDAYIEGSLERHNVAAAHALALQRQTEDERSARLEAEAGLLRAAAEHAQVECARAEKERNRFGIPDPLPARN